MKAAIRTLALLVAAPFLAATADAADKVRFQTDWLPSGEHAMYYGGWQKGIFAEEGIDITITRGYGSGDTLTKLAGGAFDFGVADVAVGAHRAGAPERAGEDHRGALQPVAALAVRAEELRHHQLQGAGRQEDQHHAGQQPQILFPESRREIRHRPEQDHLGEHGRARAMAAQLIAKNIDAAPFYSIHHYYINKAAKAAGEEIIPLPFVEVGFKIYAATIIATDKTITEAARSHQALPARDQEARSSGRATIRRRPASCMSRRCPRSRSTTA